MCEHLSWNLRLKPSQWEDDFWRECADKVLFKLDVFWFMLGCMKTLKSGNYDMVWPGFSRWWQVLFALATVQLAWSLLHYHSYLRQRNRINMAQRLVRLSMALDLTWRMRGPQLAEGVAEKWGMQSATHVVVKVVLLVSGTSHFLDHACSKQLPFLQTAVLQMLSVGTSLGLGLFKMLHVLSLPEYVGATRDVCSLIETCVSDLLAVGTGTGVSLKGDLCLTASPESAAFLTLVTAQLFLGLLLPLYACFHVERACKLKFLEQRGHRCAQKQRWGMWTRVGLIFCAGYHLIFLIALLAASWLVAEMALPWCV